MSLERDLIAYYEAEARDGRRTTQGDLRVRLRAEFADLLAAELRRDLVDVGAGPGLDTLAWRDGGHHVVGVDLAHANAEVMQRRGAAAVTASLFALPFRSGAFSALWTMSTFVHVPHDRFHEAIGEMLRVVAPGAPLGIGTWGGIDFEGRPEVGELPPYRFFSLAAHDRWRQMLSRHGNVERFETFDVGGEDGWDYQFAVLRS